MKSRQFGFTMIELIVVIVILGVLAATALPKFFDIGSEAKVATVKGVAAAAGSAMALNYSGCALMNHAPSTNKCVKVTNCSDVGSLMQGGMPTDYTVASSALGTGAAGSNGVEGTCTVTAPAAAASATFLGLSAGTN